MSCNQAHAKDAKCGSCGLKYELCADGKMRRTTLPATVHERRSSENAFMTFIRRLIGMELTKAGFPVSFFEPMDWLHRMPEQLEYVNKLRHASDLTSPADRMAYAVGIINSMVSIMVNSDRVMAINPILGETFELCRPDYGFRIVCEQTLHHPPALAFYLESVNMKGEPDGVYRAFGNSTATASFSGTAVEIHPRGFYTLELLKHHEAFTGTTSSVKIVISNLLRGVERFKHRLEGQVEVFRHLTKPDLKDDKLKATLKFYAPLGGVGLLGNWDDISDPPHAEGWIENESGDKLLCFYGKYSFELFAAPHNAWEEIGGWKKALNEKKSEHHKKPKKKAVKMDYSLVTGMSPTGVALFDFALPRQKLLWRKDPLPLVSLDYFRLPKFAMQLNEIANHPNLPPTDARFRQDIRALEEGDIDTSGKEKYIIEEKQRADLRQRLAAAGRKSGDEDPWKPLWFFADRHPYLHSYENAMLFNGEYYKRDWSKCPDLAFRVPESYDPKEGGTK